MHTVEVRRVEIVADEQREAATGLVQSTRLANRNLRPQRLAAGFQPADWDRESMLIISLEDAFATKVLGFAMLS